MSSRMILSDLVKCLVTRSIARPLCDSWACAVQRGRCRVAVGRATRSARRAWTGQPRAVSNTHRAGTSSRAATAWRSAPTTTTSTSAAASSVFPAIVNVYPALDPRSITARSAAFLLSINIRQTTLTLRSTKNCSTPLYKRHASYNIKSIIFIVP